MKLQAATNENSSLKLIIDLLNAENKPSTQSHQGDFKADNKLLNVNNDISCGTNSSSQHKTVHSPHDVSDHDQYAVPTSNHYAALSTYSEHQFNDTSLYSHPAQSSRNYSRTKTNHSIKPHWKKSLPRTLNESHPVRHKNNHNLQELENEEENRTIPTIVNRVSMKTNSKYNLKNRNAPIDSITTVSVTYITLSMIIIKWVFIHPLIYTKSY